jgi:cell division protein FtsZ
MNDVKTVMRDSGVAIMGSGKASGEGRAKRAVQTALESPLLNDNDINGANFILLNITFGQEELLMDEISEITDHIQEQAGMNAEVIWGYGQDPNLGEDICVTVIATGFHAKTVESVLPTQASQPVKHVLDVPQATNEVVQKVTKPTEEVKAENVVENKPEVEPFMKTTFHLNDEVVETPKASILPQADLFASEEIPSISSMKLKSEEPIASEKPNFISLNDEVKNEVYSSENTASDSFMHKASNVAVSDRPARAELMARNKDREMKIREFTLKLKSPSGLNDLENEPAYMRRKVSLENVQHSTESTVSRFSLNESVDENGEKRTELRDNNPFLHDNVD